MCHPAMSLVTVKQLTPTAVARSTFIWPLVPQALLDKHLCNRLYCVTISCHLNHRSLKDLKNATIFQHVSHHTIRCASKQFPVKRIVVLGIKRFHDVCKSLSVTRTNRASNLSVNCLMEFSIIFKTFAWSTEPSITGSLMLCCSLRLSRPVSFWLGSASSRVVSQILCSASCIYLILLDD